MTEPTKRPVCIGCAKPDGLKGAAEFLRRRYAEESLQAAVRGIRSGKTNLEVVVHELAPNLRDPMRQTIRRGMRWLVEEASGTVR